MRIPYYKSNWSLDEVIVTKHKDGTISLRMPSYMAERMIDGAQCWASQMAAHCTKADPSLVPSFERAGKWWSTLLSAVILKRGTFWDDKERTTHEQQAASWDPTDHTYTAI